MIIEEGRAASKSPHYKFGYILSTGISQQAVSVNSLPKDTAEIGTGMAEKFGPGTRQTDGKNWVLFGEIERKLAKLSMPTFTYRSSS